VAHNISWFDPITSGQALLFDVVPSTTTLVAAWFTIETGQVDNRAKIGAPEHRWFTLKADDTAEDPGSFLQIYCS